MRTTIRMGASAGAREPAHDRCYCGVCYPPQYPDRMDRDNATYPVPRGWMDFDLMVPTRASDPELNVFTRWSVSFHGWSVRPGPRDYHRN